MIEAAAKRFASRFVPAHQRYRRPFAASKAPQCDRSLDNGVERGYERPLIEDVTMARCYPDPDAMTRDTIGADGDVPLRRRCLARV